MKWIRVLDTSPYIESGNYSEETCALVRRLYRAEEQDYPLLFISIHPNTEYAVKHSRPLAGFMIGVGAKQSEDEWWDSYGVSIPMELFADLQEMLEEVKIIYEASASS